MQKIILKIILLVCYCSFAIAGENIKIKKEYIHSYTATLSDGTSFLNEKLANGGFQIFTDGIALNNLTADLIAFNDTANVNLNVFYGRVFLDYDRFNWEELVTGNEKAAIQTAFKKMNEAQGYIGDANLSSVLETIKPAYSTYLATTNGKASVLFIYLETFKYDLVHSTANAPKWIKHTIYGFVNSYNLNNVELLKINYVKSLRSTLGIAIPKNTENKPDAQYLIKTYVDKYIEEHKKALVLKNPNCPNCPLNPASDANYWDAQGRLWRYTKTNCNDTNWVDLSYEFSNTPCGNDTWKQGLAISIQDIHKKYYDEKINYLKKYPLQQFFGGVTPELEKNVWQATQFATIYALKDEYVSNEVGWQGWVPFWGSALTGYYQVQIANGDMQMQVQGGFNFVMSALDISLVKSIAQGIVKIGIKKWIIDGGIKIAAKNAWYRAGKGYYSFKLGYLLRNAPIEGVTLYEKQLANGIEIVDETAQKYIKFDKLNNDILVGKFSANSEKEILFEKNGKLYNVPQNLNEEQLSEWLINNVDNVSNAGSAFTHVPTSGALITNNAKQGTFLIGSYPTDLQQILGELYYPKILNVDFAFPVPSGQKFNLLNISDAQYNYWMANGGFFTKVNGPWIDAAVIQNADVIVVSNFNQLYNSPGVLSGFGKEVHRLEWKHGYRFDPSTKMMVPPSKATGLPTKTLQSEYTHN